MANGIRAAAEPCADSRHEFTNYYYYRGGCGTSYCGSVEEWHCIKCGWYIEDYRCGANRDAYKTSYRQRKAIDKRMEQKRKERGQ